MIQSATRAPTLMGTSPLNAQSVAPKKDAPAKGYVPPSIHQSAKDALHQFPPNPAVGPFKSKTPNLDALKLTPPSGQPLQPPLPSSIHLNPLSHETINGALVKKGFEQLHSSINNTVAQQRKTAQTTFNRKVEYKAKIHQNSSIYNAYLSTAEQLNQKAYELHQSISITKAQSAYDNMVKDHARSRQLERDNQTSQKIGQATLDQNVASEKVAHVNRSIEAKNSNDNVKDNQPESDRQNKVRILMGNQHYLAQINLLTLQQHQKENKVTQTRHRSNLAHAAYTQSSNQQVEQKRTQNLHELQGQQLKHQKEKSQLNQGPATQEHYQATDYKRATASQLYSANERAVNKALTIKDPAGALAF
jgi:hypothetical protein